MCSKVTVFVYLYFREKSDKKADEREWEVDIEDELREAEDECRVEFEKNMEEYRSALEKWKKQKLAKVGKISRSYHEL